RTLTNQTRDDLPHPCGIVRAELAYFAGETAGVQRIEHRLYRRRVRLTFQNHQVIALLASRNEVHPPNLSRPPQRQSRFGLARRYRRGDFEMAAELAPIAGNTPRRDFQLRQRLVEHQPRAGARLAVGYTHARPRKVGDAPQLQWIATPYSQSQLPAREIHHHRAPPLERLAHRYQVVLATLAVAQMHAGRMYAALEQR